MGDPLLLEADELLKDNMFLKFARMLLISSIYGKKLCEAQSGKARLKSSGVHCHQM